MSDVIHVKWLPRFLKHFDQIRPGDTVADAETGKSVNFRKCAQNNNIPAVANELKRVWRIIQELKVGFVKDNDDVFRDCRHEVVDLALRNQSAGWVVGIGDKNEPGFRRGRIQHRLQVLLKIRTRRFDGARAESGRD